MSRAPFFFGIKAVAFAQCPRRIKETAEFEDGALELGSQMRRRVQGRPKERTGSRTGAGAREITSKGRLLK